MNDTIQGAIVTLLASLIIFGGGWTLLVLAYYSIQSLRELVMRTEQRVHRLRIKRRIRRSF